MKHNREEEMTMGRTIIMVFAALLLLMGAAVGMNYPELRRYLRIRRM